MIVQLGRWVLENACRQAADWQHRLGDRAPAKVSINVSARQLAEPDFIAGVEEIITRTGADRSRLVLEVTETAVLGAGAALDAVRRLRDNGLRVALDDFGTGQSSLSLLLTCPVDILKVDKSFVSGSAADHAGAVIVQNLIGFTDGLHIEAIAEGVETPEQAQRLHDAGYRFAQGYLFGRPMPPGDVESLLAPAAGVTASVR
jgi:EAL domain-containing protein (putative c-di-GMP-specific phosphodiesterase class I)